MRRGYRRPDRQYPAVKRRVIIMADMEAVDYFEIVAKLKELGFNVEDDYKSDGSCAVIAEKDYPPRLSARFSTGKKLMLRPRGTNNG